MKSDSRLNTDGILSRLEFELAYLSLLTKEGVKPLSRWEKPVDDAVQESLSRLGLKTRVVERSVQTGREVRELILSTSDESLEAYASRFSGAPVTRDCETVRLEGRLFGYPPCCVESFAARGYVRNSLRRQDQRILFHWACPGCGVTPLLIPEYRRVYTACLRARHTTAGRSLQDLLEAFPGPRLRTALAAAAALAALGFPPAMGSPGPADWLDPHMTALSRPDDPDLDFLTSSEEVILERDPAVGDQDGNSVPDGVDLARRLANALAALPSEPASATAFATHHQVFGLENCTVCGASVNMGFLELCHPLEKETIQIPYIAEHFLEHGSFSYSGTVHSGRVSPPLLQWILETDVEGHLVAEPAGTDPDRDGLRTWEEPAFGTDPQNPDSDGDRVADGMEVARELLQEIQALPAVSCREDGPSDRPFVVKRLMYGVETCPRCGAVQTMGLWDVINPVTGNSVTVPTIAIHYLEHGSFGWDGGELLGGRGRVDPRQLRAVLTGQPNDHLLPVSSDRDADWLSDLEEASLRIDPSNPDEDGNAVQDGLDLARVVACEISGLPTAPNSSQVYRLDFPQRGLERCGVCATNVNMGWVTICNPWAHLSVDLPYIALHYLEHDSLSFGGDVHGFGRSEVKMLLDALLRPAVRVEANEREVSLRLTTKPGWAYRVFAAADPAGPWTSGPLLRGDGTERVFTECAPPGRTRRFYKISVWRNSGTGTAQPFA